MRIPWMVRAVAAVALAARAVGAQELITNGGFETGDFTGWTRQVAAGSNGDLRVVTDGPGFNSGLDQIGPRTGTYYALTDQNGPGAYSLLQSFTIGSAPTEATLRFALSVTSYGEPTAPGLDFDFTGGPRQFARVDLFAGALADGFSSAVPLQTFFAGPGAAVDGPQGWQLFDFDLTSVLEAPGTYTLRFNEIDNQLFFNLGVDDVSLVVGRSSVVPEPATFALVGGGVVLLGFATRRRAS